ncbi:MAG: hypothetical protein OXR66_00630 [Candidatus Woesearchaeota archaeon]|nr:hypothetical protein [Candidatus Woesearchaeota archaeon]
MFDKLKFWQSDKPVLGSAPDPLAPSSDPMQIPDPLAGSSDPLATADPLQSTHSYTGGADPLGDPQSGMSAPGQSRRDKPVIPEAYPSQATFPDGTLGAQELPEPRERDAELVLAKLDAIKAELDALHQRIRKIENISEKKRYW